MCMANLSIYTFIHLNLIVSFKEGYEHAYPPQTVTDALNGPYIILILRIMLYNYKSLIDECIMVGYIYNHGGIMKTGELLTNPTSLIAPTLHGYR